LKKTLRKNRAGVWLMVKALSSSATTAKKKEVKIRWFENTHTPIDKKAR
jgi:hypothetical protein